jgi:hypothetical protein
LEVSGVAGVWRECNFKKEETYPDESTKLLGSLEERDLVRPHGEVSCSWLKSHSRQAPASPLNLTQQASSAFLPLEKLEVWIIWKRKQALTWYRCLYVSKGTALHFFKKN